MDREKRLNNKVLFVDDDEHILEAVRRCFHKTFNITTALSAIEGLNRLEKEGPFAVVVCDMHMPRMNGIQFLETIKEKYPATVRVMLTGSSDLGIASEAINKGNIFRFATKPCPNSVMMQILEAGTSQYYLETVEQELLENTLKESINVLLNILSLTHPQAFSKSTHLKLLAKQVAEHLKLTQVWLYEVAALLSQLGYVVIPSSVIDKMQLNQDLSEPEKKMLESCSKISSDLIKHIPRLEDIAQMIVRQEESHSEHKKTEKEVTQNPVIIGAEILKAVNDFDTLFSRGLSQLDAVNKLQEKEGLYNIKILSILKSITMAQTKVVKEKTNLMNINTLRPGMILGESIWSKDGKLLAVKGYEVSETLFMLLINYHKQGYVQDNVLVSVS